MLFTCDLQNRPLHQIQGFVISRYDFFAKTTLINKFYVVRMIAINPRWVCLFPWKMNENIWWLFARFPEIWEYNRLWSRKFNVLCRNENKTTSPSSVRAYCKTRNRKQFYLGRISNFLANIKCNSTVLFNEWNEQRKKWKSLLSVHSLHSFVCIVTKIIIQNRRKKTLGVGLVILARAYTSYIFRMRYKLMLMQLQSFKSRPA